ncbi:MAG: hypothetical protein M1814_002780 [Vezdaea aestivalis]|nr:MAG: hypothetical protein M1814_002780 [Vezdaea aestivalis]
METSSSPSAAPSTSVNDAPVSTDASAPNRRKSGRVVKKPQVYAPSPSAHQLNGKRKRDGVEGEAGDLHEGAEDASSQSDEDGEDESESSGEEEAKAKRKRPTAKRQPAAKRVKINGVGAKKTAAKSLAHRPAGKAVATRQGPATEDEDGLFVEVFSRGHTLDSVAANWLSTYQQNNSHAMRDLVNFLLKCSGCDLKVTEYDIQDQDHVSEKIVDLQEEYQAQNITEYPLMTRSRSSTQFRQDIASFVHVLLQTLDASALLYDDPALIENLQLWVATMSSSGLRPFRHTATTFALAIGTSLCEIARRVSKNAADTGNQIEGEKKKGRVNKARVADLQKTVNTGLARRKTLDEQISEVWELVYVHRYRDIEEKIRLDCSQALGRWTILLPEIFFDLSYLRYLAWVLSDESSGVRLEVVKALQKLFQNKANIGVLRTFVERFRERLVEMACRDAEINVRVSTIDLLDLVQEIGFLEPDDIDTVGSLLFDSEPRVRKAAASFFVRNLNEVMESKIEELGGEETVLEALADDDDKDYEKPRPSWIKLKLLVESLTAYDSRDKTGGGERFQRTHVDSNDILIATGVDSRFALAAQALFDKVYEIENWQMLAGYVLFDHTGIATKARAKDSLETVLKRAWKLDDEEELAILEMLNAAVTMSLLQSDEAIDPTKRSRKKRPHISTSPIYEATTRDLAQFIPLLLKKFGPAPNTASIVLRLQHVLNLDIFHTLRQDNTSYAALLDDINRQFLSHSAPSVLTEASAAFLHAKGFEDLEDVTDGKLSSLWTDTILALQNLVAGNPKISQRGSFRADALASVADAVRRVASLATISDCVETLEHTYTPAPTSASKRRSTPASSVPFQALTSLLGIAKRGALTPNSLSEDIYALEEDVAGSTIRALLFYFMWKKHSLADLLSSASSPSNPPQASALSTPAIAHLSETRQAFIAALTGIINTRPPSDSLRIIASETLLDLHTLFATLRPTLPRASPLLPLITSIPAPTVQALTLTFHMLEKTFAKRSHKNLLPALPTTSSSAEPTERDEAAAPEDPASEEDEEVDEDQSDDEEPTAQHTARVLASEQRLCAFTGKLVLALIARVVGDEDPKDGKLRERLVRNRIKLGPNFKEVVAYLDEGVKGKKAAAAKKPAAPAAGKKNAKSKERVEDSEDDEADPIEDIEVEEGGEEDLRRRGLVEEKEPEEPESEAEEQEAVEDEIMGD